MNKNLLQSILKVASETADNTPPNPLPLLACLNLSDLGGVVESTEAQVHIDLNNLWKSLDAKSAMSTCGWEARGKGRGWLLAWPILQEYNASTVDELSVHPAEFGKLAARHNLVEIAEACRRKAEGGTRSKSSV